MNIGFSECWNYGGSIRECTLGSFGFTPDSVHYLNVLAAQLAAGFGQFSDAFEAAEKSEKLKNIQAKEWSVLQWRSHVISAASFFAGAATLSRIPDRFVIATMISGVSFAFAAMVFRKLKNDAESQAETLEGLKLVLQTQK